MGNDLERQSQHTSVRPQTKTFCPECNSVNVEHYAPAMFGQRVRVITTQPYGFEYVCTECGKWYERRPNKSTDP